LELKLDATVDQVKKAYRKLMIVCHPDKVQRDPQLKTIAERRAKEINGAREEIVAYLKERKNDDNQDRIIIGGGESYGKVSDFFNEICRLTGSGGIYHLDVYWAYRLWCTENGLCAVSIDDLDIALQAKSLVPIRKNIKGIESIFWPGIELVDPQYFMSEDFVDYDLFEDGMPREFPEPKEYADVDDDDDLGEVLF